VEFDFTAEQLALRDLARDLFEKESPPSRLRELWDVAERDPSCWRAMASVGLTGLTIAEEHGGMGGDDVDLALVLEEAGRTALPEPLLETVGVVAPLLAGTALAGEWLPRIASGDAIATIALGDEPLAVDADTADLLIATSDGALHALPKGSFTATRVETEDRARRVSTVAFDASAGTKLDADPDTAFLRAATHAAGMLNGISAKLLETTVAYAKTRNQFGRPVGSFQAVKHALANAHVGVESSRAATWYAAYAMTHALPDAVEAASVAKSYASDAAREAGRVALQAHGGIGFTWEHDLHLWLKRGKALEQAYGSAAEHRRRIARGLFEGGAGA
jgi:alkylation response protein AidB-like acyl-CoA dehydrogenase